MNDNSGLYFTVGALFVAVIGLGLYFGGFVGERHSGSTTTNSTTIQRSVAPDNSTTTTITKEKTTPN